MPVIPVQTATNQGEMPPTGDMDGKYLQTSSHWGPHHGPQTALLEGF